MSYSIERIQFYVRETRPARFASALGKAGQDGKKPENLTSPLCHVRMTIKDSEGNTTFGCSADRLSVRWLDKRPGRDKGLKLRDLVSLIEHAGGLYLAEVEFESPFDKWIDCHEKIVESGRARGQEDLTSSFASALMERAMIDGVCRLAGKSLFSMLRTDELGFRPEKVHAELKGTKLDTVLPRVPQTEIRQKGR